MPKILNLPPHRRVIKLAPEAMKSKAEAALNAVIAKLDKDQLARYQNLAQTE